MADAVEEEAPLERAAVRVRWSAPIPTRGADASPIPNRGGVYEILFKESEGFERMYVGESEDLRRAFISHVGGSKGGAEMRRAMKELQTFFRYWLCDTHARRVEVVAALSDLHCYDHGHDPLVEAVSCVSLIETV